ncbi:MAG: hypothetical protein H6925_03835 [Holosporaceae bacterium]|nr:MAG: hypothetical protein H6925_03835 [Holosporaceae bacterium]
MVQQHACLYGDLEFRPIKNGYDVYTAGTCCRRQVGTFTLKGTSGNHILEDFETTITSDVGILNLRAAIEQRIQHWNKEKR